MGQFCWKTSDTKRAITIWDCEDLDPAEDDPNQGWGEPEDDEE